MTAVATLVGDTTLGGSGSIAFASDGTLYMAGTDSGLTLDVLATVNPTSAAVLTTIPIGDGTNTMLDGLAVRHSDGVIFATHTDVSGQGQDILTVDPLSGITTLLGTTDAGAVGDLAFGPGFQQTTLTDAAGLYSFTNVPPGTYVVSEVQQSGFVQTYPEADETTGEQTHTLTLDSGQLATVSDALQILDFGCLLYTSPSPRDLSTSRMPSSA